MRAQGSSLRARSPAPPLGEGTPGRAYVTPAAQLAAGVRELKRDGEESIIQNFCKPCCPRGGEPAAQLAVILEDFASNL